MGGNRITFNSKSGPLTAQLIRTEDSPLGRVGATPDACTDCSHTHSADSTAGATGSEEAAAAAASVEGTQHEHKHERKPATGQSPGKRILEVSLPACSLAPLPREEWAAVEEALGVKAGAAICVAKCAGTLDWLVGWLLPGCELGLLGRASFKGHRSFTTRHPDLTGCADVSNSRGFLVLGQLCLVALLSASLSG